MDTPTTSFRSTVNFGQFAAYFAYVASTIQIKHNLLGKQNNRHLFHNPSVRSKLEKLLDELNVELKIHGNLDVFNTQLVASNHVSWLDALVLSNLAPYSFIAKEEVKSWPLIGGISRKFHVQYIRRQNKFAVYRSLATLEQALSSKKSIVFFPEGTTTDGSRTEPFYPMIFEAAVRTRTDIQPVAIQYTCDQGLHLPDVAFIDDDTLIDTLIRMFRYPLIQAHVHVLDSFNPSGLTRKECALKAREMINGALAQY